MSPEDRVQLETKYRASGAEPIEPIARDLHDNGGLDWDEAWLTAGALLSYTGVASIPVEILAAAGVPTGRHVPPGEQVFPKVTGSINAALQGGAPLSPQHENLLLLFLNLDLLTKSTAGKDPTRMMDAYPAIDTHYAVGNVLLFGEVGSVSRNGPAPGYGGRVYRLHFHGGLIDINAVNRAQQEMLYVPGSAYRVTGRRVGKPKRSVGDGGGKGSHIHLTLQYAPGAAGEPGAIDLSNGKIPPVRARWPHRGRFWAPVEDDSAASTSDGMHSARSSRSGSVST